MEQKLQVEREPIQQLLREDCVRAGLVDKETAERLIRDMTGKTSADAEREIVEQLRDGRHFYRGWLGMQVNSRETKFVQIQRIARPSPLDIAGAEPGDVITAVNRVLVRNLRDLQTVAGNSRILFLLVQRGDRALMLQIR